MQWLNILAGTMCPGSISCQRICDWAELFNAYCFNVTQMRPTIRPGTVS